MCAKGLKSVQNINFPQWHFFAQAMECPICLEDVGGVPCVCGRKYHAACVYGLLKNGYTCCQSCFARFPPILFLLGSRHGNEVEGSSISAINYAAALTGAKKGHEAIHLLQSVETGCCKSLKTLFYVELGRANLQQGRAVVASRHLRRAVDIAGLVNMKSARVRALAFLCRAYSMQNKYEYAKAIAAIALESSRAMHYTDALYIMHTMADIFWSKGCKEHYTETLRTICSILEEESRDPFARASADVELAIAEGDVGSLRCALRILRKRDDGTVQRAALTLASLNPPAKRLRTKTHPEDMS